MMTRRGFVGAYARAAATLCAAALSHAPTFAEVLAGRQRQTGPGINMVP
jgi:hypothetical protein